MTGTCADLRDLLEMHADRLLDDPELSADRTRAEAHLEACAACREAFARNRALTDSLAAFSRVSVSVSVEDRVMSAVRQVQRPSVSPAKKAVLGGAIAASFLGEAAAVVAVALAVLAPLRTLVNSDVDLVRAALRYGAEALVIAVNLLVLLGGAVRSLLGALSLVAPSPAAVAALFVLTLLSTTFIAVRRDLHRSADPARGSR